MPCGSCAVGEPKVEWIDFRFAGYMANISRDVFAFMVEDFQGGFCLRILKTGDASECLSVEKCRLRLVTDGQ